MNVDTSTIDPDERILRRIPNSQGYYDPKKAPPVGRGAFTPNEKDIDGLSVYLAREVSPAELVAATRKPADRFLVAQLRAADFYSLGLSLIPDPQPDLPGHTLVPQINRGDYDDPAKKPWIKEVGVALANLASSNIVFGPHG